jgi:hypothetical protein
MSIFSSNDAVKIQNQTLNYSYGSTTLYNNDATIKTIDYTTSLSYNKIVYNGSSSTPNFSYTANGIPAGYIVSNIYLFGLVHNNIESITTDNPNIVGELVIEHTSISSNARNKLYACFLISNPSSRSLIPPAPNDIDNIYNMIQTKSNSSPTQSVDINLNNTLPKQDSCIIYTDNKAGNTVIVFLNPVPVLKATAEALSKFFEPGCPLFNISAPNNYVVADSNDNAIINDNDNEIYIDCNLTDPTDGREVSTNTYNVPINSYMTGQQQQLDFMKTTVNFFIFIIGILFIYFTIPGLYKIAVINKAIRISGGDSLKSIRSADIFITLLFAVAILITFSTGVSENDYGLVTAGLFLSVFYGLGFSIIQVNKTSSDFMTKQGTTLEYPANTTEQYFDQNNFGQLIMAILAYCFWDTANGSLIYLVMAGIFVMLVLIIMRYATFTINDNQLKKWSQILYLGILPVFVPTLVWICIDSK